MERKPTEERSEESRDGRFEPQRRGRRRPFVKPEIKREEPLKDVTLFTSTANVTGARFFP